MLSRFHRLSWLLPASLFAVSGLAKAVDPVGAAPASIAWLTARLPYPVLLRSLGLLELGVAALALAPRTRRWSGVLLLFLLSAFSVLAALNAQDAEFLRNCGCFGGLKPPSASWAIDGASFLLVRNALLCGLVVLAFKLRMPGERRRAGTVVLGAGLAASLLLLGTLYLAERTRRLDDLRMLNASLAGGVAPGTPFRPPSPRCGGRRDGLQPGDPAARPPDVLLAALSPLPEPRAAVGDPREAPRGAWRPARARRPGRER